MLMWDYIRDFFVQYIFGGYTFSGDAYGGFIGHTIILENGLPVDTYDTYTYDFASKIDFYIDGYDGTYSFYLTVGDWLSTTATIICMVLISICFILLIRWIFKAVASAFLLK